MQEGGTHRLHLLGGLRTDVGGVDLGPHRVGGTQRGQAGDTGTDDEDLGRRNLASSRDLAAKGSTVRECSLHDSPVTRDVGHRGQSIHGLSTRDTRNHVHTQAGDAGGSQLLGKGKILTRMKESDEDSAGAHEGDLVVGGFIDGQHEVGLPRLPRSDDPGSGLFVRVVRQSGVLASSGLDDHLVAEFE